VIVAARRAPWLLSVAAVVAVVAVLVGGASSSASVSASASASAVAPASALAPRSITPLPGVAAVNRALSTLGHGGGRRSQSARRIAALSFGAGSVAAQRRAAQHGLVRLLGDGRDVASLLTGTEDEFKIGLGQEPHHWSLNDLGDVATFALLADYDQYHQSGTPDAGDLVIRRRIDDALAASPAVRALSSADTRRAAASLEFDALFYAVLLSFQERNPDAAALRDLRSQFRAWLRAEYGLDIVHLRVTAHGLGRR
jgi:hypothetical protein